MQSFPGILSKHAKREYACINNPNYIRFEGLLLFSILATLSEKSSGIQDVGAGIAWLGWQSSDCKALSSIPTPGDFSGPCRGGPGQAYHSLR